MKGKSSFSENRKNYILKVEKAYKKYAEHMKRTVLMMMKDETLAEDAVHNVFEKLIKGGSYRFEEGEPEAAYYLTASARNEARKLYVKQYKHGYPENIDDEYAIASSLDTEEIIISRDSLRKATDFIKRESPMYADMFILYYSEMNTIDELAEMNDLSEAAVRKGIYRLKMKVAEFLREER